MSVFLQHNFRHLRKNVVARHFNSCNRTPMSLARNHLRYGGLRLMSSGTPVKKKNIIRRVLGFGVKTILGVVFLAGCAANLKAKSDPGFARVFDFWTTAFPIFVQYKIAENYYANAPEEETEKKMQELHEKFAPRVRDQVLRMGGFFQKHAQFCSNMSDFFPEEYLVWMRTLQDKAACPISNDEAKRLVAESLGRPLDEVFMEWQEEPVGSASIGQVYKAKLYDGTIVAVKLQSPGVEEKFRLDIATVRKFCAFAVPQQVPWIDEIEKQFATEFDYIGEAHNLNDIATNLEAHWGDDIYIPKPYMDLCTREVLTMDFCTGGKFIDRIKAFFRQHAKRTGRKFEDLEKEMKERMQDPKFKFASLEDKSQENKMMYWMTVGGDLYNNMFKLCYNYSLGFIFRPFEIEWSLLPVDLGKTLKLIMDVHGHQLLIDGCFNGDPHPGNLLLCDDGRLGLIDFGQVKRWDDATKIIFAKLQLACHHHDKEEIVRLISDEMKYKTKEMKPEVLHLLANFYFDCHDPNWPCGRHMKDVVEWIDANDPILEVGEEFVMAARCIMMLRFLGKAFGVEIKISDSFAPFARECLRQHGVEYKLLDA